MDQRARVGEAVVGQSVVAYVLQIPGVASVHGSSSASASSSARRRAEALLTLIALVSADAVRYTLIVTGNAVTTPTKTSAILTHYTRNVRSIPTKVSVVRAPSRSRCATEESRFQAILNPTVTAGKVVLKRG